MTVRHRPRPHQSAPDEGPVGTRREGFHEYIPIGELHIDTSYQRDINYAFVTEMSTRFDYGQLDLQAFSIGRRLGIKGAHADYIIDGQHRWLALLNREPESYVVGCYVRISPGSDWEANEYLRINFKRKNPTAAGRYKAAVTAGRKFGWENDAAVSELLTELGIETVPHTGQVYHRGGANGVPILFAIQKVGNLHERHPEITRLVLTTMRDAWAERHPASAYDGIVFDGLTDFFCAHLAEMTEERPDNSLDRLGELVKVLRSTTPLELRDAAALTRGIRKYPVRAFVARGIAEMYNAIRRGENRVREVSPQSYVTAKAALSQVKSQAAMTPEARSDRSRRGSESMTPAERRDRSRRANEGMTPEARSDRSRRASEGMTPAERSERARRANEGMTPEARSDRSRRANERLTPEERSDRARRANETRREQAQ